MLAQATAVQADMRLGSQLSLSGAHGHRLGPSKLRYGWKYITAPTDGCTRRRMALEMVYGMKVLYIVHGQQFRQGQLLAAKTSAANATTPRQNAVRLPSSSRLALPVQAVAQEDACRIEESLQQASGCLSYSSVLTFWSGECHVLAAAQEVVHARAIGRQKHHEHGAQQASGK